MFNIAFSPVLLVKFNKIRNKIFRFVEEEAMLFNCVGYSLSIQAGNLEHPFTNKEASLTTDSHRPILPVLTTCNRGFFNALSLKNYIYSKQLGTAQIIPKKTDQSSAASYNKLLLSVPSYSLRILLSLKFLAFEHLKTLGEVGHNSR